MSSTSFAEYITAQMRLSGKTQREIATDMGYANANVMTMFKKGQTKVPIEKVPELAKALGLDPVALLKRALREYSPGLLGVLETHIRPLTRTQTDWLNALEKVFGSDLPKIDRDVETEIARMAKKVRT